MGFGIRTPEQAAAVARHADAAVVAGNIFQEPLDRVVSVRGFVDGFRVGLVPGRPLHHEAALGFVASADVLEDKEIALRGQFLVAEPQRSLAAFGAVRGPGENERQRTAGGLRSEDQRI